MRKYIALFGILVLLAALCCGCADAESAPTSASSAQEELYFVHEDVKIMLDMPAEDLLPLLPEPRHYSEATSCAFPGLDKTYDFGSFAIQTCPSESGDRVHGFWFQDDSVTTAEGVYIGMTKDEAARQYPDASGDDEALIIEQGGGRMTIAFQDGLISSIQYFLVM